MSPRRPRLTWNDVTEEKLAAHRLDIDCALEVVRGSPKFFRQEAQTIIRRDGSIRRQPARRQMIGPDRTNRLYTFILEYPDDGGRSHIVTGWPSDEDEISKYRHPGGRQT